MIYVHIPFCERKCPYCAFSSFAGGSEQFGRYFDAMITQLNSDLEQFGTAHKSAHESLYIGGGTPSFVPSAYYKPLFDRVMPLLKHDAEITVEANPNSANEKWLTDFRRFGANRISIGAQSFDDHKLKTLGRIHSGTQAFRAVEQAREAGFEQVSSDLIIGVAGDTITLLLRDLDAAISAGATHISAYSLSLEAGTPFEARSELLLDDHEMEREFAAAVERKGLPRYEVSSYGAQIARHNCGYWAGSDYLGIGAGAVGTVGEMRYEPHKNVAAYIADPLYKTVERLSLQTRKNERLMLGLRCNLGVPSAILSGKQRRRAALLIESGMLTERAGRLYNADFALADEVWLFING